MLQGLLDMLAILCQHYQTSHPKLYNLLMAIRCFDKSFKTNTFRINIKDRSPITNASIKKIRTILNDLVIIDNYRLLYYINRLKGVTWV
jgi:hypothetical protein